MASTLDFETTDDAFLGGKLTLSQPRSGYRAGVDPVLLAAAIPAMAGQTVLDLGCGMGAAMLCLHARIKGLRLTGVELQQDYAALAQHNSQRAGAMAQVICADITALPADLRQHRFDHVIANPPYFDRAHGPSAQDAGRDLAFGGATALNDWVTCAAKRVAPRGQVTMIQKADRLPQILRAFPASMGSVTVLPIVGRAGKDADRIIVQARQDGKSPFRLLSPLVLHAGTTHGSDAPDYMPLINDILRNGAALSLSD